MQIYCKNSFATQIWFEWKNSIVSPLRMFLNESSTNELYSSNSFYRQRCFTIVDAKRIKVSDAFQMMYKLFRKMKFECNEIVYMESWNWIFFFSFIS